MNAGQLLAQFDRLVDSPEAVPRLRRFILDLAVRGKLVAQDLNDEPASALLERVEAENARLVRLGEVKKLPTSKSVGASELPGPMPSGWQAARMESIARKLGAGSTPLGGKSVYQTAGIPFLRSQNVHDSGLDLNGVARISDAIHRKMSGTHVQRDDILLNITGASIGRCALVPEMLSEGNVSQHVAIVRLILPELRGFIHLSLISPFYQGLIDDVQVGVSREGLSMQRLRLFPMLIPPLAEQHRIVAKVNELMALCDRLEAALAERERRRDRLATASLARLNNGADAAAFREHARFHLRHLARLTTRPEHVKQLRKTILNLAVRGRLVPQDPNDEPATSQLEIADRARRATASEDRRADRERQALLAADKRWQIPSTWEWRALADVALFIDYRGKTPTKIAEGVRLITAKNIRSGFISLAPEEYVAESTYHAWMTRGLPREGDVLFTTEAPMGNAAVFRLTERVALAQRAICFRLYGAMDPDFLALQIRSEPFQSILQSAATGLTAKGIKAAKLKRLPIAVPPLADQRRIVAKASELDALYGQLALSAAKCNCESSRLLKCLIHRAFSGEE